MPTTGAGRGLAILAVGFLSVDALMLGYAGFRTQRIWLLVSAGFLIVLAGVVIVVWRLQRARLEEIRAARASLKDEVTGLRALVKDARQDSSPRS